jgi:hypothetical protein
VSGKLFPYQLAQTLELGTGQVLTQVDGYYDTQTLVAVLQNTQDRQLYPMVVERLWRSYDYDALIEIMEDYSMRRDAGHANQYVHALFNSSRIDPTNDGTLTLFEDVLTNVRSTNAIDVQDYDLYLLLTRARRGGAQVLVDDILAGGALPVDLRTDIQTVYDYYQGQRDVPLYYRDGLIAMVLVQHGYFTLAQKIALDVLSQNSNYILPYQIFAQSHFITRDRQKAQYYLQDLLQRDPSQSSLYHFLLGIAYYRQEQYDASIIAFGQVDPGHHDADVARYRALAYHHLDQYALRDKAFATVLEYEADVSDFYSYFLMTYFQPFQEGLLGS